MRPFQHITIVFFSLLGMLIAAVATEYISGWWIVLVVLVYIHLLVLGSIFPSWNFYLFSYYRGRNAQWIALSFDDGPAQETGNILDILNQKNVPAAFFAIGKNAQAHPQIVKRWYDEGHLIGNHSYHHSFHFDWKGRDAMAKEMRQTNDVIENITGKRPLLFRPPYGVTNPNLAKAIKKTSMVSVAWSLRSFDTAAKDKNKLLSGILRRMKGGDIILLHDSVPVTCEILTELIDKARQNGFTFVRLDQMLGINAYA